MATLIVSFAMAAQTNAIDSGGNLQLGVRIALVGLYVNIAFAVIKISAGVFGHAYALIADGIESTLDVAGSLILWGALRFAARPPDATHPYGHGKAEPVAAIIVAFGVLAAAAIVAFRSTVYLFLPHPAPATFTLWVAALVVFTKETLFQFVNRVGRKLGSTAVIADAWRHRADVITSAAAFIGISIALIGGEKWRVADNYAAIFACVIIALTGIRLCGPALSEILDTAPRGDVAEVVQNAARSIPGVVALDKCFLRKMGTRYYVDLHVQVNGELSVRDGHEVAHRVKDAIRATNSRIADVLVHIEPA